MVHSHCYILVLIWRLLSTFFFYCSQIFVITTLITDQLNYLFVNSRSILDLNAVSGSFVMNPPIHCTELIDATLNHIDRLLSESNEPLSFIVLLADGETAYVNKLDTSRFKRRQVVIPAYEHYYRHGFQYSMPKYVCLI